MDDSLGIIIILSLLTLTISASSCNIVRAIDNHSQCAQETQ